MQTVWNLLTLVLIVKVLHAIVILFYTIRFLMTQGSVIPALESDEDRPVEPVQVYVLVPLLREQRALPNLFIRFLSELRTVEQTCLVFVTTQREIVERRSQEHSSTTMDVLRELLIAHPELANRILHYHYPTYNRVVAEQLNYAISELTSRLALPLNRQYVAVYNADSVVGDNTFLMLEECARSGVPIMQQSSLFLANVPLLLKQGRYYAAMHGIYQSCWTLQHEIPRYLVSSNLLPCLPRWIVGNVLVHCVTHGMLIRLDVLKQSNGFPVLVGGGEDLAIGFLLRAQGYRVVPTRSLENSETPERVGLLWRQLAGWFLGTMGYWGYWRFVPATVLQANRLRVLTQTVLGIFDSCKWLAKGFLVLLYGVVPICETTG